MSAPTDTFIDNFVGGAQRTQEAVTGALTANFGWRCGERLRSPGPMPRHVNPHRPPPRNEVTAPIDRDGAHHDAPYHHPHRPALHRPR